MKPVPLLLLPLLFAACASTPPAPLPPTHPASTHAPEASRSATVNLAPDQETLATRQLLKP